MYKLKNIIFVFLCLAILVCSSCIYASDVNETAHNLSQHQDTFENTTVNNNQGSFDELNKDIQNLTSGDVYNIEKDYCFTDSDKANSCITIGADNITINGNAHYIDGKDKSLTFKITGNNVKIFNLNFCNCHGYGEEFKITIEGNPISTNYVTDMSPIYWKGNNGTISNCIFLENGAVNGGAITWAGDNGNMNNLIFINNSAKGVGGAIYLTGRNNNINDTIFINSTSQLINESVYLDKHDSFSFKNIQCDNIFFINGTLFNVNANNLRKVYYSKFCDENINIIPIIYSSLFTAKFLNEDTYCYGAFSNETQTFTMVLAKIFDEYNITYENEYIIHARNLDEVFAGLISNYYEVNTKLIKTMYVNNLKEYNAVCNTNLNNTILKSPVMSIVKKDSGNINNFNGITYVFNVIYANNSYFSSNQQWSENNGFNITIINGNGATIHATSGDRDENKWIVNKYNQTFAISNLTVEGFNTAIENLNGTCIFNNVCFNNNRMDYLTDRDDGAAILNAGVVMCDNCTFTNNYAKNGGAIFTQGLLILENCTFKNNKGYGTGNDVLNVDEGIVILNGKKLSGAAGPVEYVESISSTQTALITFISAVGVISATVLFTCVGFIASGGNPIVAMAVGISVGLAVTGTLGVAGAYSIASHQYNLNFDRKATFIAFTASMAALAVQSAAMTTGVLKESNSVKSQKTDYKKNDNGRLCVKIDGEYYIVSQEANLATEDGKWYKMDDLVEVNGHYYLKDHVVEVDGKLQYELDCEYIYDKNGNGHWYLRSDCINFENEWYCKEDCIKLGENYYPQSRINKIGDSYFLKLPNEESKLIYVEPKQVIPEKPSIEVKYFNTLNKNQQTKIINKVYDVIEFDNNNKVVGWSNQLGNLGTITEVSYNSGNNPVLFIKYTDISGIPKQITILFNSNYNIITRKINIV